MPPRNSYKDEFLQAIHVLALESRFMSRIFRIMRTQVDQLYAFIRTSFLKEQLQHIWLPARAETTS